MKPGVPWSVKGIEPQARESAKDAARKAGLTLGQWLNQTILEQERDRKKPRAAKGASAEKSSTGKTASGKSTRKSGAKSPAKSSAKSTRKPAARKARAPRPLNGAASGPAGASNGVDARLEELSRKLDQLAAPAAELPLQTHQAQMAPLESGPLGGRPTDDLIGHLIRTEQKTDTAINAIRQDMTRIAEYIDRRPPAAGAGLPALEKTLSDMVEHIELTDRHNSEVLRTIQARLSELSSRMDEHGSGGDREAIDAIEHRLASIVARLDDPDQAPDSQAYQALEAQISVLNDHMTRAQDPSRSGPAVAALEVRLNQLADRLSATEQAMPDRSEFDTLKSRLGELQEDMSKLPKPVFPSAIQVLETRLGTLAGEIDALRASAVSPSRFNDFGSRLDDVHSRLRAAEKNISAAADKSTVESRLEELQRRLQKTERGLSNAPDINTVETRFEEVQQRIHAAEEGLAKCADTERLESRLAELSRRLDGSISGERTDPAVQQLEARVNEIVRRLDEGESDLDGSVFKGLENQINRIGLRLDQAEERFDTPLQTIQANLSQLYESLESSHNSTLQAAEQAAVAAAQKLLANPSGSSAGADATGAIAALEQTLLDIKTQNNLTDRQTQETLEAVHDTLERVIERLTRLEAGGLQGNGPQGTGDADEAATSEAAPNTASGVFAEYGKDTYSDFRLPPLPDVPPVDTAEPETGADAAADEAAAPTGAEDAAARADAEERIAPREPQLAAPPLGAGEDDDATEPKFARAYDAGASADGDGESGFSRNGDFIAAARRAAQAAALEENADGGTGSSGKSQPALIPVGKSKKRTLLYAIAALFLAVGALSVSGVLTPRSNTGSAIPASSGAIPEGADEDLTDMSLALPRQPPKAFSYVPDLTGYQNTPGLQLEPAGEPLVIEMVRPAAPQFAPTGAAPESAGAFTSAAPRIDQNRPASETTLAPTKSSAYAKKVTVRPAPAQKNTATKAAAALTFALPPASVGSEALRRAAASGNAVAQFIVGANFADGRTGSVDNAAAAIWYERAAEGGNRKAMHNLAVLLANTTFGQPDFPRAARWFLKAAEMGLADSQFNLGILHERGLGVEADPAKAYKWFRIAAAAGDIDARDRGAKLENTLPAGLLARTRAEVAAWRPKTPDPAANVTDPAAVKWAANVSAPKASSATAAVDTEKLYVSRVQRLLAELGYDPGPTDGLDGPKTRQAIRTFERERGLPVTGRAGIGVVRALEAAAG